MNQVTASPATKDTICSTTNAFLPAQLATSPTQHHKNAHNVLLNVKLVHLSSSAPTVPMDLIARLDNVWSNVYKMVILALHVRITAYTAISPHYRAIAPQELACNAMIILTYIWVLVSMPALMPFTRKPAMADAILAMKKSTIVLSARQAIPA